VLVKRDPRTANGWFEATTHLRYILLETQENCIEIEGEQTWLYSYDPETKQQFSQWKNLASPRPTKESQVWKHKKFVSPAQLGNQGGFSASEGAIPPKMSGTRTEQVLGSKRQCAGTQCCACATIITGRNIPAAPPPPPNYHSLSARFRSCHFVLLRRLKSQVKGCCYEKVPEIQEQLTVLHDPPKSQFQWCFQQWQIRLNRCINSTKDDDDH